MAIPLSIQDLVPAPEGVPTANVLAHLADLARLGEDLGYERIWYAEHHGMPNIASSSPDVLIAHAAAKTQRIRIGAGGVMLPNHVPLRVAETYRTLEGLYPGRINLGIGRAGGTDERTLKALRSAGGEHFSAMLSELLAFEGGLFNDSHPFSKVNVIPDEIALPPIWMLGSSGASASAAGSLGLGYAFASHFSPAPAAPAFQAYREAFEPSAQFPRPHAILCVAAICAPTMEEAQYLAGSTSLAWLNLSHGRPVKIPSPETAAAFEYSDADRAIVEERARLTIVGDPAHVRAEIAARAEACGADEVMIATIMHGAEDRLASYRLIAEAFAG